MKSSSWLCAPLLLAFTIGAAGPSSSQAQDEAVLESYTIGQGGNQAPPGGLAASLTDRSFGNGTAKALVQFAEGERSSSLSLLAWRRVRRDEIVPALLVFRVEVRGFDATGEAVYARDLNGFTFGDSRSGLWSKSLIDLPAALAQVRVTFFGNYE